ncbi:MULTISPECIES: glycosyltransferase family 4 protein [unclassified Bosea (in: a-proteobacteria)]|uniref:MraY family glycosyltransferase n=1 Tax=unclassified Bosea (in: a-proteobacteria) TaxID=2653178 RepID=UPI000F75C151|nr:MULTISPECIES: glycosyltransferase family 4 protein [unclassified Bosea (in: a-proteobacteria)]AZO81604.1 glycosyl transferase [Bosea sp. Tri-49]
MEPFAPILLIALSAGLAFALCLVLRPLMMRYALARPNARSSHRTPTPQGGGIAVLAGAFLELGLALALIPMEASAKQGLILVMAATTLLALVGAWDDIRPLSPGLRLPLQFLCVGIVVFYAAPEVRLLPEVLPLWAERGLALIAGVWFVNLLNFMDGIDWITLAGLVPLTGALALGGSYGVIDPATSLLAAALFGGLLGFAPFNKPVARIFLGDVGALPLGLLGAYLLYRLAGTGALTAALILPLYHVMDSTITLLRRLARGEKVWQAHRSHFYQQATDNGFRVIEIVTQVFLLNLGLVALAAISITVSGFWVQLACLLAALVLTTSLLYRFSRKRARP